MGKRSSSSSSPLRRRTTPRTAVGAHKSTRAEGQETREEEATATDLDVRWADVQVNVAAERLTALQQQLLDAQRDLADRAALATKMSEAQALLPAIFVKFPLAHSMTISQSGRRAGPLPLVVAGF